MYRMAEPAISTAAADEELRILQQTIASLLNLQDLDDAELNSVIQVLSQAVSAQPLQLTIPTQSQTLESPPTTPVPRLHADRWHTPVSVERVINGRIRGVKWFSDFQAAYMYVEGIVDDEENDDYDWSMAGFLETADRMDRYWEDGEDGLIIARCRELRDAFIAYYEPTETVARQPRQPIRR